jgi:glycosyltransferase involved in cell wall biosynthesis
MRVLHLITRRQRRGAEVFAGDLADALVHRGHDVLVAGLYDADATPLIPERAAWTDLDARAGSRFSARTLGKVIREVRSFHPDLVQANGSDTLKYSALTKCVTRARWPLVYRNISVASRWLRNRPHRALSRWMVGYVDHVAAVSEVCRDDFLTTYGIADDRVTMIPRAIRIPGHVATREAREQLVALTGIPGDAEVLMHVGSFSEEKNHAWLVDAFAAIRARRPGAHLVLLGDGALRARVAALVAERGLRQHVHLLGTRRDADVLVAAADALVLPSLVEGIPGVVLEAGAQAVPAVATDVGGVREAIRDGQTGLLVRSGDLEAFVASAVALLEDPARRRRMGAAAREFVRARFDLETIVDQYEALYHRLSDEARARHGVAHAAAGLIGA